MEVAAAMFYPLATATAFWGLYAYQHSLKQKLNVPVELASQDPQVAEPFQGGWGTFKDYALVETRGRFRSVRKGIDELGAEFFLVDYGNGRPIKQYHDPRVLL